MDFAWIRIQFMNTALVNIPSTNLYRDHPWISDIENEVEHAPFVGCLLASEWSVATGEEIRMLYLCRTPQSTRATPKCVSLVRKDLEQEESVVNHLETRTTAEAMISGASNTHISVSGASGKGYGKNIINHLRHLSLTVILTV